MTVHVTAAPAARHSGPRDEVVRYRLRILSDIRLDLYAVDLPPTPPDCDAVLVAGGVGVGLLRSLRLLAEALGAPGPAAIAYVPGPTEFADGVPVAEALAEASAVARELGIALLHDASLRLPGRDDYGLHILGSVLWPSFEAAGRDKAREARGHARHRCTEIARASVAPGVAMQPHDAVAAHHRTRTYMQDALASVAVGGGGFGRGYRTLVPGVRAGDRAVALTAYPPSPACLPPSLSRPLIDPLSVAWRACDMAEDLDAWGAPALWVHGGSPTSCDLRIGRTRIVCNPFSPADPSNGWDRVRILTV